MNKTIVELEAIITERTLQLTQVQEKLKKTEEIHRISSQEKFKILSSVAHDLANCIQTLSMNTDSILSNCPPELLKRVERIERIHPELQKNLASIRKIKDLEINPNELKIESVS